MRPEVLEEETFEDWGDAVEALEEESEEVASAEPEGEPEVLEEETFEDWGDAVEALEEESEEVASAEPEGEPEFWKKRRLRTGVMQWKLWKKNPIVHHQ